MRLRSIGTFALIAALTACDSSTPVAPQVDVDAALSQMTAGATSYGQYGMGGFLPTQAPSASSCAYDAPSSFFVCPPITANGISFTRRFQLLDASGAPLSTVNPLAVASIKTVNDVAGTTTASSQNPVTLELKRHEEATLSGIQSPTRVLDGTATSQLIATASGDSFTLNDTTVTTQLQVSATAAQKYPLGGTIVSSGAMYDASNPVEKYRIVMKFDGTSIVTITSTLSGQTFTCKVNMASPDSTPVCS